MSFEKEVMESLTEIKTVLGGSDLGEKGLVEQFADLKTAHYKVEAKVKKMQTVWTVLGSVFGIVITGINIFVAWLTKN